MHLHRYEKIWLIFGVSMLFVFLAVLGVGAFAMGMEPPGDQTQAVDPAKIEQTPPFDHPGLRQLGDKEYEANMLAFAFGYLPENMEVPVGSTVHFNVTSKDVVHGFNVIGTNINMMVVPGEINHITYKFTKPGTYLLICNEYCGIGHEYMKTTIVVK